MIYILYTTGFSTLMALSIMIIVTLMNLVFNGEKYILFGKFFIALMLGLTLILPKPVLKYSLSYFFVYLLVTSLSFFVSHNPSIYLEHVKEEKKKYEKLFENIPIAIAHHALLYNEEGQGNDYRFIDVNKAVEVIIGIKKDEIIGKKLSSVLEKGMTRDPDFIKVFNEVAETGQRITFEKYLQPLNKWVNITAYSESPGHFKTVFKDITEEKK